MKILLVSPVRDPYKFTNKGILIPQLALFILQGLTPEKHEVKIVEEEYILHFYLMRHWNMPMLL